MYNYTITRLSYLSVFRLLFAAGVCTGGLIGIMLGLMDRQTIGLLGGMFLGLVFGLSTALVGLIYTAVFNILAPVTGGIAVEVSPLTQQPPEQAPSSPTPPETLT